MIPAPFSVTVVLQDESSHFYENCRILDVDRLGLLLLYGPESGEPLTAYHETKELRSFEGRLP